MRVEIFDRPLCCETGVCGPDIDPVLPQFASDVDWLKSQGIEVARYNLAHQPMEFANVRPVQQRLQDGGPRFCRSCSSKETLSARATTRHDRRWPTGLVSITNPPSHTNR